MPDDFLDGADLAAHFAASDIALEHVQATRGTRDALAALDDILAHARHAELPALARHLAATRVSMLADDGRVGEAGKTWTEAGLPDTDGGCVDLDAQSWREVESLSCARLRLLGARGDFRAVRRFGHAVLRTAAQYRLRRTEMRIRALCIRLEHRGGDQAAAFMHLAAFVELFVETDYARALRRERDLAAPMLDPYLATEVEPGCRAAAGRLLTILSADVARAPQFTQRETEVLARLGTQRDDDIAAALGFTRHGVRFHVQNIFRKLGARTRREASQRARVLGAGQAPD